MNTNSLISAIKYEYWYLKIIKCTEIKYKLGDNNSYSFIFDEKLSIKQNVNISFTHSYLNNFLKDFSNCIENFVIYDDIIHDNFFDVTTYLNLNIVVNNLRYIKNISNDNFIKYINDKFTNYLIAGE
jgi:hypothetical protein